MKKALTLIRRFSDETLNIYFPDISFVLGSFMDSILLHPWFINIFKHSEIFIILLKGRYVYYSIAKENQFSIHVQNNVIFILSYPRCQMWFYVPTIFSFHMCALNYIFSSYYGCILLFPGVDILINWICNHFENSPFS